jgi:hypothetical protein
VSFNCPKEKFFRFENEEPDLVIYWNESSGPSIAFSGMIHKLHEINILVNLWSTGNNEDDEEEDYDSEALEGILPPTNLLRPLHSRIRGRAHLSLYKLLKMIQDEAEETITSNMTP